MMEISYINDFKKLNISNLLKAKMHFWSLHFGSIPILVPKLISLQIPSLKKENHF